MSARLRKVLSTVVLLLLATGVPRGAVAIAQSGPSQEWERFVASYVEGYFDANPHKAVAAGRHEYDGRLPDWSAAGLDRFATWLHERRDIAQTFDPTDLGDDQRFERDYLIAAVDGDLFWRETAEWPYRNPAFYTDALDPDPYVSREYAPLERRMRAYVAYAQGVPSAVRQIRQNLRTPMPRTYASLGRIAFGGLARFYRDDVPGIFAAVENEALQDSFRLANAAAIQAMNEMDAWFAEEEGRATDDFALGPERFQQMLWATERVDTPLETLRRIAERDLERNLASLREACAAFAPDESIDGCISRAQADKPEHGPVEGARRQLNDLKRFVLERDLVSIPGTEEARVAESPPYQRWNSAYISIPGPYEKDLPSVYYIAPPDPSWTEADRQAYIPGTSNLLFISVHEVWPGHFLHFLHANRAASSFGRVFVGYAFGEGWAHYAEEMMWDAGLGDGDPEVHIGQLLNALLRDVRFLSAIGLHTGGMTVEESERLFREKAYQDPGNARQQAARGTFDPAYLNYTMGKLMIRKLWTDWEAAHGGASTLRAFHDAFLGFGGPPIPLVRSALLGDEAGPIF